MTTNMKAIDRALGYIMMPAVAMERRGFKREAGAKAGRVLRKRFGYRQEERGSTSLWYAPGSETPATSGLICTAFDILVAACAREIESEQSVEGVKKIGDRCRFLADNIGAARERLGKALDDLLVGMAVDSAEQIVADDPSEAGEVHDDLRRLLAGLEAMHRSLAASIAAVEAVTRG